MDLLQIQTPRGETTNFVRQLIISQEEEHMPYVDTEYINVARTSETQHHERTMDQLREKIAQLTKALDWEMAQHESRLKELQQVEDTLRMKESPSKPVTKRPTLDPVPSSKQRWTKSRKYVHRSIQKPVAELVG